MTSERAEDLEADVPSSASSPPPRYSPIGILIVPRAHRSRHIIGLSFHPALTLSLSEISQQLSTRGFKTSVRQSYLRISSHLYNTPTQIRHLYAHIRQIIIAGGRRESTSNSFDLLPVRVPAKVLIVGGSAWLGQYVFKALRHGTARTSVETEHSRLFVRECEIHLTYCTHRPHHVPAHHSHQVDLASADCATRLDQLLATLKPEVIIHLAAQSSLVNCDRDRLTALSLNSPLALIHAVQSHVPNSLFLYTSTDLVYEDLTPSPCSTPSPVTLAHSPLHPTLLPTPSTTYGQTKLQFESHVLSLSHGLVLRLSNMLGGGYIYEAPVPPPMKFLQWLQKSYLLKTRVALKADERRSFVSAQDTADLIQNILEHYLGGMLGEEHVCWKQRVYNVGGVRSYSRLELGRILCEEQNCEFRVESQEGEREMEVGPEGGRPVWVVSSVLSDSFKPRDTSATVALSVAPKDVTMDCSLTEIHFRFQFRSVEEVMGSLLAEL
jgi:dTDP-4-dehydrorhamnose reductase